MNFVRFSALNVSANDIGLPTSTSSLSMGIANVVKIMMALIGAASVLAIIIGGIILVTSAGEPARVAQGKNTIMYAVIGVILALSAYAIVSFISGRF